MKAKRSNTRVRGDALRFAIRTHKIVYGVAGFFEYEILMYQRGTIVGFEEGPRRTHATRARALKAARQRTRALRAHRLYVIPVKKKHIDDGVGRDCSACAIAQALWHSQERMGLPKYEWDFRVSPYACFVEADGITLAPRCGGETRRLPVDLLPDLVVGQRDGRAARDGMVEWAQMFDEWEDSRCMTLADWREINGYCDGERPWRPTPASFVLDLDAMCPESEITETEGA